MTESKGKNYGYIAGISGSLITVKGLENEIRLNDLIKVINHNIIGQVIQIYSDYIIAQCFENTYNLKLREKVENLFEPLSMELAPGLLSNIFDGIQRPLKDAFKDIRSEGFLERGLTLSSLSQTNKWYLVPKRKLNENVSGGDIIGTVQETPLIEHRIMLPLGITGELTYIAEEGEYTILDEIYRVKHDNIEKSFNMIQRWPINKNRPYIKRMIPKEPLITGIRVIDLLFPIAKGGTVAVPGGFGTGKCVTGETPVLLSNGDIYEIKEIYDQYLKQDGIIELNDEKETIIKIENDLSVFSLNKNKYEIKRATHLYRCKTKKLVKIITRTGRKIEITPIHKLFTFNGSYIREVEAKNLKIGDFVLVPRFINIEGQVINFDAYKFDKTLRVVDENALKIMENILDKLKERTSPKELAKKLGISYSQLKNYHQRTNNPPLSFIENLSIFAKIPPINVRYLKSERKSGEFCLPERVTKELAEWLGLFVADGHIKGEHGGIYLYNNSKQILDRFSHLTKVIFQLDADYGSDSDEKTPFVVIYNITLRKFLYHIGIPKEKKTHNVIIPRCILKSPKEIFIHFLAGYYSGDGSFYKYTIEFSTVSKNLHRDVSYLLSRLGILYRAKKKNNSFFIYLDGKFSEQLAKILYNNDVFGYEKIQPLYDYTNQEIDHFEGIDILPINKEFLIKLKSQGRDKNGFNIFRKLEGIRFDNYIKRDENISLTMLKRINNIIIENQLNLDDDLSNYFNNLIQVSNYIYFDRIEKIETIQKDIDVYDLTVEDYHNFIGGINPFILHNTVTQQSLAKWSNADVIVYIGCGERGNEIADVLKQFSEIIDPKSGRPLLERIVLIANTSNMPVSARGASIFSGVTIAEYYRDMGYDVAVLADSTSRYAESLREISGLLEEMPAEEGYPAYLPSRLSNFYERAGVVKTFGNDTFSNVKIGSLTIIGSVSPPSGDFSEPVTSTTRRFVQAFWALDANLAYSKHYPAINWLDSYSNYPEYLLDWWFERDINWPDINIDWMECREQINEILSKENDLKNVVQLIGEENLPEDQQLILFIARLIREGFLIQNAFDDIDNFTDINKLLGQAKIILLLYKLGKELLKNGFIVEYIKDLDVINDILRISQSIKNNEFFKIEKIRDNLLSEIESLKLKLGGVKR